MGQKLRHKQSYVVFSQIQGNKQQKQVTRAQVQITNNTNPVQARNDTVYFTQLPSIVPFQQPAHTAAANTNVNPPHPKVINHPTGLPLPSWRLVVSPSAALADELIKTPKTSSPEKKMT